VAPKLEEILPAVVKAATLRAEFARLARDNPILFASFVLRDEQSGEPIKPAPMHFSWHDTWSKTPRSICWAAFESGKTSQMVGRILWELGRDPGLRVVVVSNTHKQAEKFLRPLSRYLQRSQELREVFPDLQPAEPWTASTLTVARNTTSKDPSIQALGVHGSKENPR